MKAPAIRRRHALDAERSGERGITMVLVALAMVAIIAMAAMSIDLVTLYLAREEAQRSADAAALAAARVISISGITGTADTRADPVSWQKICGGATSAASQAAQAVGGQNAVGSVAGTVTVTYSSTSDGTYTSNCSLLLKEFAVNPLVKVVIQRASLPTFFSRIWGNTGNSVSASAIAETFNPSASDAHVGGLPGVIPVQPRCVKPWIVPNQDPGTGTCSPSGLPCLPFVDPANGAIRNPGISLNGGATSSGVIGETFTLFADCAPGSFCAPFDNPPQVDSTTPGVPAFPPQTLEYLPGMAPPSSVAVPSCAGPGSGGSAQYQPAVAGCDQSTVYQCGVPVASASPPNSVDLRENPGGASGDTAVGVSCLINEGAPGPANGQDILDTSSYPFKITAGDSNPLGAIGTISSSNSIVSLPIYDGTSVIPTGTTQVMIVGFLQVFINWVNADGSLNVTVLNVSGCGNDATNPAITGTSPVPVRLITPP